MTYYSSWIYSAIHILVLIPEMNSAQVIAEKLSLPISKVQEVLEFLLLNGLIQYKDNLFKSGKARIHLGRQSPMISIHHTNWRMRAINAFDKNSKQDLFFSGPICISRKDAEKIRSTLLNLNDEVEPIIQQSKDEVVYCLFYDFFEIY